jgi:hypothetical protein
MTLHNWVYKLLNPLRIASSTTPANPETMVSGLLPGDTAANVLSASLTRAPGATVAGGPYAISLGTLTANDNYTISAFTGGNLGFALHDGPTSVLRGTLHFTTTAKMSSPPGSYAITPSGLISTSRNYTLMFASGTLTVLSYAQATANLQVLVDASGLDAPTQSALDGYLQAAIAAFNRGNNSAGFSQLRAFITYVTTHRKHIGPTLAGEFIADAERVINAPTADPITTSLAHALIGRLS